MNTEQRLSLIKHNTEEILTENDLRFFLDSEKIIKHYIGFEISGKVHLGTGLMCMQKVKDFIDAGIDCTIFLADWHTWINEKLDGDFNTIKRVAVGYFKEAIKAALKCVGGNPENLNFILGSDLYHKNDGYWETVIDVAKHVTLSRMQRSITILGKKEGGEVDFAKLIYPAMQVADIFEMSITLAHAGLDQRKAHVIMRDVADKLQLRPLKNKKRLAKKPVAIHHELLLGLGKPNEDIDFNNIDSEKIKEILESFKMSKSKESSAIFIHDDEDIISEKITKAFCPPREIIFNPILNWTRLLIFNNINSFLEIKREDKFGGDKNYYDYKTLEVDFQKGDLHPMDLKKAVTAKIIEILKPAREYFAKGEARKTLDELEQLIRRKTEK